MSDITEEELEALETKSLPHSHGWAKTCRRLIAEVRRQREDVEHANAIAMGAERRAEGLQAKIEEQAKEIAKLKGETTFGHGRPVSKIGAY